MVFDEKFGSDIVHVNSVPAGKTMSLVAAPAGKASSAAPKTKHNLFAFIFLILPLFGSCVDSADSGGRGWGQRAILHKRGEGWRQTSRRQSKTQATFPR